MLNPLSILPSGAVTRLMVRVSIGCIEMIQSILTCHVSPVTPHGIKHLAGIAMLLNEGATPRNPILISDYSGEELCRS